MLFPILFNLIEINRKELYDLAEKNQFNFHEPSVFEKSLYLDNLINIYLKSVTLLYFNLSSESVA